MHYHLIEEPVFRPQSPKRPKDVDVANISTKIAETLEQFDAQLLAAERELEVLRNAHAHARFDHHNSGKLEIGDAERPPDESPPTTEMSNSALPRPDLSGSAENESRERGVIGHDPD